MQHERRKMTACGIVVEKARKKETARNPRHMFESNIKIYLREMRLVSMDQAYLAQDRDRWRATFGFHKCWEVLQ
jgi:hypothetical protein